MLVVLPAWGDDMTAANDDIEKLIAEKQKQEQAAKDAAAAKAREVADNAAKRQSLQDAAKARWETVLFLVQEVHAAYAVKAHAMGITINGGAMPYGVNGFQSIVSNVGKTTTITILITMSATNTLHCRLTDDIDGRKSQGTTVDLRDRKEDIEAVYEQAVRRIMFPKG